MIGQIIVQRTEPLPGRSGSVGQCQSPEQLMWQAEFVWLWKRTLVKGSNPLYKKRTGNSLAESVNLDLGLVDGPGAEPSGHVCGLQVV